jgi:predicted transcriptional regulator
MATKRKKTTIRAGQTVQRQPDYEKWFIEQVEQGLKEARAGKTIDHQTIAKKWASKRAVHRTTTQKPRE